MKKVISLLTFILVLAILNACSNKDEVTPEERLGEYVALWNDQKFGQMYDMLSTEATETYPAEQFVDRYEKIYGDVQVEDLTVTFEVPESEAESKEEASAAFPVQVKMQTIAGPVSFEREIELVKQESEETANWFVKWNPGFIFPELANGADVGIERIQPERGEITDRNGNELAANGTVYTVGISTGSLGENPEETIKKLSELLAMDVAAIEAKLNADWVKPGSDLFVPLKTVPATNQGKTEALSELDGVTTREDTGRVYPYGEATAHLTGYIGSITAEELEEKDAAVYSQNDLIGKRGAESLYEKRLKGKPGIRIVAEDDEGEKQVIAEKEVEHGENIQLTIDAELQATIYNAYDEKAGTAAAIHPKTGETLALVSSPAFDPNMLTYGVNQETWEKLQENPNNPLLNRFAATFAPGSTIKPITAAIGLESGAIKPDEAVEIEEETWQADSSWGDYRVRRISESNEPVDVTNALVRSDNIFFAQQAVEMGAETLIEGLQQFGFEEKLPFAYPIETATISSSGQLSSEVLLADTSYGQGQMETSALYLAVAYTPFLNNGNLIKPVLEADEPTGTVWKEGVVSAENVELIRSALRQVVTSPIGTANSINLDEVALSGKTGTAELKTSLEDEEGKDNGWFIVYPEQEDLLISMMMEDVGEENGSHYVVDKAEEIFKKIR